MGFDTKPISCPNSLAPDTKITQAPQHRATGFLSCLWFVPSVSHSMIFLYICELFVVKASSGSMGSFLFGSLVKAQAGDTSHEDWKARRAFHQQSSTGLTTLDPWWWFIKHTSTHLGFDSVTWKESQKTITNIARRNNKLNLPHFS